MNLYRSGLYPPPFSVRAVIVSLAVLAPGLLGSPSACAVTLDMVTVGNPGNANDPATGSLYGGGGYAFQMGKYEAKIGQYTEFLNAVAATDTYSLYNTSMGSNLNIAGITRSGSPGSYTYAVTGPNGSAPAGANRAGNRPIRYVSRFDAARFSNWVSNGQPTGARNATTPENGVYFVNGLVSGTAPAKNATNPNTSGAPTFYISTENEWYKAAFFSPEKGVPGVPGYYAYATQSDSAPGNAIGSVANQAKYLAGDFSVTQSGSYLIAISILREGMRRKLVEKTSEKRGADGGPRVFATAAMAHISLEERDQGETITSLAAVLPDAEWDMIASRCLAAPLKALQPVLTTTQRAIAKQRPAASSAAPALKKRLDELKRYPPQHRIFGWALASIDPRDESVSIEIFLCVGTPPRLTSIAFLEQSSNNQTAVFANILNQGVING